MQREEFPRKKDRLIIPEHFEPLNRILRATIPERESQLKSIILFSVDYLQEHYL